MWYGVRAVESSESSDNFVLGPLFKLPSTSVSTGNSTSSVVS